MTTRNAPAGSAWHYDPGEKPKKKHGWAKNEAGFVKRQGHLIGKCPKNLDRTTAEWLLNEGIPEDNPRQRGLHPKRIYNIHEGVLYRAVPTQPGVSYHGFPELAREFEKLDDELRRAIWNRARQLDQEGRLKIWLRKRWRS